VQTACGGRLHYVNFPLFFQKYFMKIQKAISSKKKFSGSTKDLNFWLACKKAVLIGQLILNIYFSLFFVFFRKKVHKIEFLHRCALPVYNAAGSCAERRQWWVVTLLVISASLCNIMSLDVIDYTVMHCLLWLQLCIEQCQPVQLHTRPSPPDLDLRSVTYI